MRSPGRKRLLACAALAAACWKSPREMQRDYAQSLRPAPIGAQSRASGPARPLRVRAYADPEYQAQTPRWSERIREQIDRANAPLEAEFGVRLELEATRTWRRADRFEPLHKALEELIAGDAGADVDWVIGFAPALGFASAAHEQLGMGAVFGRHLVVRGMFSLEETRALETVLDKLPREERDALLRERRIHKETAVLLHEWAHTLGAFHEHVPGSLMSPMYEPSQAGFSPGIVRLLLAALEQRGARDEAALSKWAAAYRDEVRSSTTIWDAATRAEALRIGEQFFGNSRFPAAPPGVLPRETARPAAPSGGDSPVANLALAHALLDRDDRSGAAAALARAESAFDKGSAPPDLWLALAQGYGRAEICSAAERTAARAGGRPGAKEIVQECARLRRLAALPRDGAVAPEREHEYLEAVLGAQRHVRAGRLDQARAAAKDLAAKFPAAPGAAVIHCLLHGRARAFSAAKRTCESVARAAPEAFFPRYFLGLIAGAERRFRDAQADLARALELDDGTYDPWVSLASVDQSLGDTAALEELKARYRKRFGAELKPALWPSGWTTAR